MQLNTNDAKDVYTLFAHIMHYRYPALIQISDYRLHSYIFVSELTQLLIALQDAYLNVRIDTTGDSECIINLEAVYLHYRHSCGIFM